MLDLFSSYYGGLLCVCWSPDGQYILTGGEDDLVSIWSLAERNIVARCQGHNSWVNYVAFDPWRCDERNYRFGSVGDDCRLLLWDFSVAMLHRPKAVRVTLQTRMPLAAYRNGFLLTRSSYRQALGNVTASLRHQRNPVGIALTVSRPVAFGPTRLRLIN